MDDGFDPAEIRAAERTLVGWLQDPDTTRRVAAYTDDAVLVLSGAEPVVGRAEMLQRPKMQLFDVVLTPLSTIASGALAVVYADFAAFVGRTATDAGHPVVLKLLMVWRRQADGGWLVCREFLIAPPA